MIKTLFQLGQSSGALALAPALALGLCLAAFLGVVVMAYAKTKREHARTGELPFHDE